MKLKLYSPLSDEINYLDFFIEQGLLDNTTKFFKSFVDCLIHPKLIHLIGSDDYLISRYLEALQFKLGKFCIYTYGDGEFSPKLSMSGLVIKGIDKISIQQQAELISYIKKSKYYHKRVILISSEAIDTTNFGNLETIQIPSAVEIKNIFPAFYESPFKHQWIKLDNDKQNRLDEEISTRENQPEKSSAIIYTEHPYQFIIRKNNKVKIIFQGKDVALKNEDLIGLHYIRFIIKYGINGLSYQEIESNQSESIEVKKEKHLMDDQDLMERDEAKNSPYMNPIENHTGFELVDNKTIGEIKDKIEDLEAKKQLYEEGFEFEEVRIIDNELEKLNDYLNKSLNIEGKKRKTNSELQKIKKRVKKNINEVLQHIKTDEYAFYLFLSQSIVLDKNTDKYKYISNPEVDWVFDRKS